MGQDNIREHHKADRNPAGPEPVQAARHIRQYRRA